jgi:hypothetical protein
MAKKTFRLADVDGTVPGVAIMTIVSIDPNTPEDKVLLSVDRFVEADDRPEPALNAEALWESTKGDWPKHQMTIAINERAKYLRMNRRQRALLGDGGTMSPREYWENYA